MCDMFLENYISVQGFRALMKKYRIKSDEWDLYGTFRPTDGRVEDAYELTLKGLGLLPQGI